MLCATLAAVGACSPAPPATLGSSSTVPTPDPVAPVITPETPVVTQPETPPTTVPEPEPAPEPEPVSTTHTHAPAHSHRAEASGLPTPPEAVKRCESDGNYSEVNSSSGAGGAWQFMPGTWRSVGGTGLPQDASPAEQDHRAALLYAREGLAPWAASRHCWAA